ncbi:unnamed protein product [Discosporangium mesarthrocarpum]
MPNTPRPMHSQRVVSSSFGFLSMRERLTRRWNSPRNTVNLAGLTVVDGEGIALPPDLDETGSTSRFTDSRSSPVDPALLKPSLSEAVASEDGLPSDMSVATSLTRALAGVGESKGVTTLAETSISLGSGRVARVGEESRGSTETDDQGQANPGSKTNDLSVSPTLPPVPPLMDGQGIISGGGGDKLGSSGSSRQSRPGSGKWPSIGGGERESWTMVPDDIVLTRRFRASLMFYSKELMANSRQYGEGEKLSLYGLFKQAKWGDCPAGLMEAQRESPVGSVKVRSWLTNKGKPAEQAMREFVELLGKVAPGWEDRVPLSSSSRVAGAVGSTISTGSGSGSSISSNGILSSRAGGAGAGARAPSPLAVSADPITPLMPGTLSAMGTPTIPMSAGTPTESTWAILSTSGSGTPPSMFSAVDAPPAMTGSPMPTTSTPAPGPAPGLAVCAIPAPPVPSLGPVGRADPAPATTAANGIDVAMPSAVGEGLGDGAPGATGGTGTTTPSKMCATNGLRNLGEAGGAECSKGVATMVIAPERSAAGADNALAAMTVPTPPGAGTTKGEPPVAPVPPASPHHLENEGLVPTTRATSAGTEGMNEGEGYLPLHFNNDKGAEEGGNFVPEALSEQEMEVDSTQYLLSPEGDEACVGSKLMSETPAPREDGAGHSLEVRQEVHSSAPNKVEENAEHLGVPSHLIDAGVNNTLESSELPPGEEVYEVSIVKEGFATEG